jgi:Ca-activated chloride channel family protein
MAFQHLDWLFVAVPALAVLLAWRYWRRRYWSHSLVEHFGDEIGGAHPILRLPRVLEAAAIGLLLVALAGPVYPFTQTRVERGGLQIMFVVDLSQSMEEPLLRGAASPNSDSAQAISVAAAGGAANARLAAMLGTPGSRMEAVKRSALDFVSKRPGDAIGLVVFSNNGYLVSPATFDHESMTQYLLMTGTQTLVNEGYTGIGEGLATANRFFEQQKETSRQQIRGQVVVLFTDGENNSGREPYIELEVARKNGVRVYMIGVELESNSSEQLAFAVPMTGGRYYNVRRTTDLEQALTDINQVEKGVFYTLSLTRNEPAYFVFVALALVCLALRLVLAAFPHFVEIS